MIRKVFKFPLPMMGPHDIYKVQIHAAARIFHVADQLGTVCIWAEVEPDAKAVPYEVLKVPTGVAIPDGFCYAGTVSESHGIFVWHYYVRRAP